MSRRAPSHATRRSLRRSPRRSTRLIDRTPARAPDRAPELITIHTAALDAVIGGLITPRTQLDPVLTQGIQQLSQAIMSVGQSLAAAKDAGSQKTMQMMQQMMQSRGK